MSLFITCNCITLQRQCWSPAWINPWDRRPNQINAKHKKNEPVEVSEQIFYMSKIISLIGSCLSLHHVSGSFQFVLFTSKIRQLLSLPVMKTWMWLSFSCESERLSEECGLRSSRWVKIMEEMFRERRGCWQTPLSPHKCGRTAD